MPGSDRLRPIPNIAEGESLSGCGRVGPGCRTVPAARQPAARIPGLRRRGLDRAFLLDRDRPMQPLCLPRPCTSGPATKENRRVHEGTCEALCQDRPRRFLRRAGRDRFSTAPTSRNPVHPDRTGLAFARPALLEVVARAASPLLSPPSRQAAHDEAAPVLDVAATVSRQVATALRTGGWGDRESRRLARPACRPCNSRHVVRGPMAGLQCSWLDEKSSTAGLTPAAARCTLDHRRT